MCRIKGIYFVISNYLRLALKYFSFNFGVMNNKKYFQFENDLCIFLPD